ncbi:MAG: hypothetical protein JJE04_13615, partial [Acidobacteriia bacterium]|nr:hypothetical protein [Terriglobia bacterium]
LYIALLYCTGVVGLYWMVRIGSGSRFWSWIAAAVTTLSSPIFFFVAQFRDDYAAFRHMPVRLGALVIYGEGPHMSALALIPFALAASWYGVRQGQPVALGLAGILAALIVANNFYGATALVIFFLCLLWSLWLTHQDWFIWLRGAAIAALAYALIASWFTPSFIHFTFRNMQLVSAPGNSWSIWVAAGCALAFAALSWRWARGQPGKAWPVFVIANLAAWSLQVLGQHFFDFRVLGEPGRHIPEFDMMFIVAACLLLGWVWRKGYAGKAVTIVVLLATFHHVKGFARHSWEFFQEDLHPERRIEYKISDWMHQNMPNARALATGSVRFWYNAWHDLPQMGGGSEQGLMNLHTSTAYSNITGANSLEMRGLAIAWAQSLGVDALIVHDAASQEIYKDYTQPELFYKDLKALYRDGAGNWILDVGRRWPQRSRVVEASRIRPLPPPIGDPVWTTVAAYAQAVEHGPDTPTYHDRPAIDRIHVRANLTAGQLILIQETFDSSWKAYSNGRLVPVEKDAMDFMLLDPGSGTHDITLQWETPMEMKVGRAITGLTLPILGWLLLASPLRRWRRS